MNIWNFIHQQLCNQKKVILLSVIESYGSSPGRQGFKMAISEKLEMIGSIGGGIMEYAMIELAKNKMQENFKPFIKRQNHNKNAKKDQSGMICSGHQVIAFYQLTANKENIKLINEILECLNNNCKKTLSLLPDNIYLSENKIEKQYQSNISEENKWAYHEQISFKNEIYIIGGGHVGLALSEMMRFLDFYIHIIDNRKNLSTLEQNSFAHKVHHADYSEISSLIPEGNNIYAVIMTHKHLEDKKVLETLLNKKIKYLGLMGSKTKVSKIYEQLRNTGFSNEVLNKVYAPIGIDIKSESPQEIAVSIAAEIIQVKNKG